MLRVYVENQPSKAAAYRITDELFQGVVSLPGTEVIVTIRDSDRPDLHALAEADVFVGFAFDVDRLRRHGRNLKLVHCTSAGVERFMPMDWLPERAKLTNSSGIHAQKAQEYAAMALLMLNSDMPMFIGSQREKRWAPRLTTPILGKRVLVVGVGRLGCAVARAAAMLGLQVEGVSKHGKAVDGVPSVFQAEALPDRARQCDFLILCCPLTEDTRGLINAEVLDEMKWGAGLVNMARGPVVAIADVLAALRVGRLGGAILDVFDREPLPADFAEWHAPNLIITPHVSCDVHVGYTTKSLKILARNLARLCAGECELENEVSAALGY